MTVMRGKWWWQQWQVIDDGGRVVAAGRLSYSQSSMAVKAGSLLSVIGCGGWRVAAGGGNGWQPMANW